MRAAGYTIAIALAACWRSAPPPAPPPASPIATTGVEPAEPCPKFDIDDPTCAAFCPSFDPSIVWPACLEKVDALVAQNYVCTGAHPRSCRPPAIPTGAAACPATGCVPVIARIVGMSVKGAGLEIVIGAGANQGITTAWTATVIDTQTATPLVGGNITLVRVDKAITHGQVTLTPNQLLGATRVRFDP